MFVCISINSIEKMLMTKTKSGGNHALTRVRSRERTTIGSRLSNHDDEGANKNTIMTSGRIIGLTSPSEQLGKVNINS
jgi:hypothetical protein